MQVTGVGCQNRELNWRHFWPTNNSVPVRYLYSVTRSTDLVQLPKMNSEIFSICTVQRQERFISFLHFNFSKSSFESNFNFNFNFAGKNRPQWYSRPSLGTFHVFGTKTTGLRRGVPLARAIHRLNWKPSPSSTVRWNKRHNIHQPGLQYYSKTVNQCFLHLLFFMRSKAEREFVIHCHICIVESKCPFLKKTNKQKQKKRHKLRQVSAINLSNSFENCQKSESRKFIVIFAN